MVTLNSHSAFLDQTKLMNFIIGFVLQVLTGTAVSLAELVNQTLYTTVDLFSTDNQAMEIKSSQN